MSKQEFIIPVEDGYDIKVSRVRSTATIEYYYVRELPKLTDNVRVCQIKPTSGLDNRWWEITSPRSAWSHGQYVTLEAAHKGALHRAIHASQYKYKLDVLTTVRIEQAKTNQIDIDRRIELFFEAHIQQEVTPT